MVRDNVGNKVNTRMLIYRQGKVLHAVFFDEAPWTKREVTHMAREFSVDVVRVWFIAGDVIYILKDPFDEVEWCGS